MPSITEQLAEVYAAIDQLAEAEHNLRKAVDAVRTNYDTGEIPHVRPPDADRA